MSAPPTQNFHAYENRQPGGPVTFYVTGEVETGNGSMRPFLRYKEPQGINDKILFLDLTIEKTDDPPTKDIAFRPARYDHKGEYPGYSQVEIFYDNESIMTLDVEIVH